MHVTLRPPIHPRHARCTGHRRALCRSGLPAAQHHQRVLTKKTGIAPVLVQRLGNFTARWFLLIFNKLIDTNTQGLCQFMQRFWIRLVLILLNIDDGGRGNFSTLRQHLNRKYSRFSPLLEMYFHGSIPRFQVVLPLGYTTK